ncbi:hypothetical protein ANCDUO_04630 [Ancylostoma duodenale]|uniref:Protein kinase domain-containing protein n=1 Tax=Ancylostoma duodenale TaxID=51022 RepID=A0A0C2DQR2_9BILA|nr:hypothetical protein ANCDUO_04630 [Ancylostoma duodenale]
MAPGDSWLIADDDDTMTSSPKTPLCRVAGGHPLSGPDPTSPTKKEVKHRFEITKKLGSGTYGKVSLAFDHKFEREVK